ncbi:MAG: shikimate kinase [Oceanicoccus sp.]|jgi:shikimate kinase
MRNIILIGMPGAGKSTLGVQLAKETARDFVDTDVLIQLREHKTLQQIMDETDYLNLRHIEEQVLLSMACRHHVIATGGSAVYSEAGMAQLKSLGTVVFLDVALDELRRRIDNYEDRGIARRPEQSFEALFEERLVLYRRYAGVVIDCGNKPQSQLLHELIAVLGGS